MSDTDPIDAHRDLAKAARELAHAWDCAPPEQYFAAIDNLEAKLQAVRNLPAVSE